jgi:hypothetical protein
MKIKFKISPKYLLSLSQHKILGENEENGKEIERERENGENEHFVQRENIR